MKPISILVTCEIYVIADLPFLLDISVIRGHCFQLVNTKLSLKLFSSRVVNVWNYLPEIVVSAPTLKKIKNRLDH